MPGTRIKLAVDARMVENSGIGTVIKNVLPWLYSREDFEIHLLGEEAKLARHAWFDRGRFIPVSSPIYGVREQGELPLRIPACDVFWSPHYNVPVLPIRARMRLGTLCDVFPLAHFDSLTLPQKAYAVVLHKAAATLCDRLITISEFSRREILARVRMDAGKLEVIPCGANPGFARFTERPIPHDDFLLFVGNVKPHKNVRGALEAFQKVAARHPSLKFVVVGRKDGFITGESRVAEMVEGPLRDRTVFTGHVDDDTLKTYYKRARAMVFPSFYEGFGLPLLEAMAFGVPVLSSDRASMPEVAGDAVLYFDPSDTVAIAARLEDVLEGRWKPDPARYAARLEAHSWERGGRRYAAIVEELAARPGGRAAAEGRVERRT